jgi:hypothetical protein
MAVWIKSTKERIMPPNKTSMTITPEIRQLMKQHLPEASDPFFGMTPEQASAYRVSKGVIPEDDRDANWSLMEEVSMGLIRRDRMLAELARKRGFPQLETVLKEHSGLNTLNLPDLPDMRQDARTKREIGEMNKSLNPMEQYKSVPSIPTVKRKGI